MRKLLGIVILLLLALVCASAFGQETQPATQDALAPADAYPEFATMSGIVATTMVVVEILKRYLGNVSYLRQVPTWVYAIFVSMGLVAIAIYVLGTMDTQIGPALWQAVKAAAIASGFYSWFSNLKDSPQAKLAGRTIMIGAVLILPLFFLSGCDSSEKAFVLAADSYHQTVGKSYTQYVTTDAALTDLEKSSRLKAHETFGQAIDARKKLLQNNALTNPFSP